jgi:hypothetical protein
LAAAACRENNTPNSANNSTKADTQRCERVVLNSNGNCDSAYAALLPRRRSVRKLLMTAAGGAVLAGYLVSPWVAVVRR